jgi:hypothetical protein
VGAVTAEEILPHLYHRWALDDVERWLARAEELEAHVVLNEDVIAKLDGMDLVPNEPFRLAYEHSDEKVAICKRLGRHDMTVEKELGMQLCRDKRCTHPVTVKIFMRYDRAEQCCKEMGLVPFACGI